VCNAVGRMDSDEFSTRSIGESVALQDIQKVHRDGETNLYLCKLNLSSTSLPRLLWMQSQLKWLNLCDNDLDHLPSEIGLLRGAHYKKMSDL